VATKFGISRGSGSGFTGMSFKGSPDYVRSCCEASLKRLGVEYIDLYYQHRVDKSVPIEDTVSIVKTWSYKLIL
jgi:aryl-alcohol dehydrogenase-like predicted oxidoreductase